MKHKVLKAFIQYNDGILPINYGKRSFWFVLSPENISYPVKIIWALANGISDTSSFHSREARGNLKKLGFKLYNSEENNFNNDLQKKVESSPSKSTIARRKRLAKADRKPLSHKVTIIQYDRNPDVVEEILFIASGKCQKCNANAPFKRKKNGLPYLEVHHKVRLADGGDDTVKNAIALCPNCHRQAHYG